MYSTKNLSVVVAVFIITILAFSSSFAQDASQNDPLAPATDQDSAGNPEPGQPPSGDAPPKTEVPAAANPAQRCLAAIHEIEGTRNEIERVMGVVHEIEKKVAAKDVGDRTAADASEDLLLVAIRDIDHVMRESQKVQRQVVEVAIPAQENVAADIESYLSTSKDDGERRQFREALARARGLIAETTSQANVLGQKIDRLGAIKTRLEGQTAYLQRVKRLIEVGGELLEYLRQLNAALDEIIDEFPED